MASHEIIGEVADTRQPPHEVVGALLAALRDRGDTHRFCTGMLAQWFELLGSAERTREQFPETRGLKIRKIATTYADSDRAEVALDAFLSVHIDHPVLGRLTPLTHIEGPVELVNVGGEWLVRRLTLYGIDITTGTFMPAFPVLQVGGCAVTVAASLAQRGYGVVVDVLNDGVEPVLLEVGIELKVWLMFTERGPIGPAVRALQPGERWTTLGRFKGHARRTKHRVVVNIDGESDSVEQTSPTSPLRYRVRNLFHTNVILHLLVAGGLLFWAVGFGPDVAGIALVLSGLFLAGGEVQSLLSQHRCSAQLLYGVVGLAEVVAGGLLLVNAVTGFFGVGVAVLYVLAQQWKMTQVSLRHRRQRRAEQAKARDDRG
jgi:hypothetical protein